MPSIGEDWLRSDLNCESEPSVRGDLALCNFGWTAGAVGRQACIADLVEQRAVTDVQSLRGLLAVPVMVVQDSENNLTL